MRDVKPEWLVFVCMCMCACCVDVRVLRCRLSQNKKCKGRRKAPLVGDGGHCMLTAYQAGAKAMDRSDDAEVPSFKYCIIYCKGIVPTALVAVCRQL